MRFIKPNNPKNCSFLWGSQPYVIHGSLSLCESVPKPHIDRFSRFLQGSSVCPTDR